MDLTKEQLDNLEWFLYKSSGMTMPEKFKDWALPKNEDLRDTVYWLMMSFSWKEYPVIPSIQSHYQDGKNLEFMSGVMVVYKDQIFAAINRYKKEKNIK